MVTGTDWSKYGFDEKEKKKKYDSVTGTDWSKYESFLNPEPTVSKADVLPQKEFKLDPVVPGFVKKAEEIKNNQKPLITQETSLTPSGMDLSGGSNAVMRSPQSTDSKYRSGLAGIGDIFQSIFSKQGDINKDIVAGATEFGTGLVKSTMLDQLLFQNDQGFKDAGERIHQENLKQISPGLAKGLDIAGQVTGTGLGAAATAGMSLPASVAKLLPFLNTTKTAQGALRATLPTVGKTAIEEVGSLGARAGLIHMGREYAEGATTPDTENRSLPAELGASMTAGTGDVIEGIGHASKWLGFDNLSNDMIQKGQAVKQGYEIPMEEFSWKSLIDPRFYAVTAGRAMPFTIAMLPLAIGGGAAGAATAGAMGMGALGRTIMGAIGSSLLSTPFEAAIEAGGTYEEARQMGYSEEESNRMANQVFLRNAALLGFTNATEYATAFLPKGMQRTMNRLGMDTTAAKILGTGLQEGAQEIGQEWVSSDALGKDFSLSDPSVLEQGVIGALMGGGFGALGSMKSAEQSIPEFYNSLKNAFPLQVQQEIERMVKQSEIEGKDQLEAMVEVMEVMAQQPEGEQIITNVIKNEIESFQAQQEIVEQQEMERTQDVVSEPLTPEEEAESSARWDKETKGMSHEELMDYIDNRLEEEVPTQSNVAETNVESTKEPTEETLPKVSEIKVGGIVSLKNRPTESFEVVKVGRSEVTLKNKHGNEFVSGINNVIASGETKTTSETPKPIEDMFEDNLNKRIQYKVNKNHIRVRIDGKDYRFKHGNGFVTIRGSGLSVADIRDDFGVDITDEMPIDSFVRELNLANEKPAPILRGDRVSWESNGETLYGKVDGVDVKGNAHITLDGRAVPNTRVHVGQLTKASEVAETPKAKTEPVSKGDTVKQPVDLDGVDYNNPPPKIDGLHYSDDNMWNQLEAEAMQYEMADIEEIPQELSRRMIEREWKLYNDFINNSNDTKKENNDTIESEKEVIKAYGKTVTAKTESGMEVEVRYAVVVTNELITSNDPMTSSINKKYPKELQPRNRERAASDAQINRMIANLNPEFLGASPKASEGAPIVSKGGVVESGNGRVMALTRGYENNAKNMENYKEWLLENIESFGLVEFDVTHFDNPILVRVRQSELSKDERIKFVQEANEQGVAAMSATEQAESDASKLNDDILSLFNVGESGDLTTVSNQDFIRAFMSAVISSNEQSRYMNKSGEINQEGLTRIRNAVFASAYDDTNVIERLAESTDNNVRNITNAMLEVAPRFAMMKNQIEKNNLYPLDITEDISQAMTKLSELRDNGHTVEFYFNQESLFDELTVESKNILAMFDANKRSRIKISSVLNNYVDAVESFGSPNQMSLFGDVTPEKLEVLETALKGAEEDGNQVTLWSSEETSSEQDVGTVKKVESEEEKINDTKNVLNDHHARMLERAERAKERIRSKYGPRGNTLSSAFPPDLMIDLSVIGYTKILDGAADFKSWSEKMMNEVKGIIENSDRIKIWLPGIYATSQQIANSDNPDALIDQFLSNAYGDDFVEESTLIENEEVSVIDNETTPTNTDTRSDKSIEDQFTIKIGKHTKTGETLWIVNPVERLSKEDFSDLRRTMKDIGGNWSNFKPNNGFLFKSDPESILIETFGQSVKETVTKVESITPTQKSTSKEQSVANELKEILNGTEKISSKQLFEITDRIYEGTQSEGAYTPKDAYDSLELAVNQYLLEQTDMDFTSRNINVVKENANKLFELTQRLPTQTKRTAEMEEFQQFSTPPGIAYIASWISDINSNDTVLEPSAGIGGMALFGKSNQAEVIVNELDPRRLDIIKQMPFDGFFMEDGEQINNILPKSVKPTVVLMNPPFSTSAGRGVVDTKNSFNHVDQALKRLKDGGRLVAILGLGRDGTNSKGFGKWLTGLQKTYDVRAALGIDGKNYIKYGTSFDVQYIVIDKTGPTTKAPIVMKVDVLEKAIDILEGIANDKRATTSRGVEGESVTDKPKGVEATKRDTKEGQDAGNIGSKTTSSSTDGVGNRPGNTGGVDRPTGNVGTISDVLEDVKSKENDGRIDDISRQGSDDSSGNVEGKPNESSRNDSKQVDRQTNRPGSDKNKGGPRVELTDSVFEDYTPKKLNIKNAKKHPGTLAESAAMSAIELPDITYEMFLSDDIIKTGKLSDAQLEVVVYAGQAHSQVLPSGERKGIFIGDGTGLGKGREMSGIILDNFNQGRTKAVWVTENDGLLSSSRRDWGDLGGDPKEIFEIPKLGNPITVERGVLFTKYGTIGNNIKGNDKDKKTRLSQIIEWLGEDFDGVIVFDEAHNMASSLDIKGTRGVKEASGKGLAGVELQKRLPNARIVYASATGATEVSNLAFAERLGLWGVGTSFPNKREFIEQINNGGIAAMEIVARDMKAMGVYLARNLSYEGVEYENTVHTLTKDQNEIYNTLAESWQIVLQNINEALKETGVVSEGGKTLSSNSKKNAIGAFWGAQQRFFNQIMTAMQMPTVIEQAKKDLADGHAVVMQLVNTNEASQKRAISRMQEEEGSLDDIDLTPRDILLQFLDNSFPVHQHEDYIDENGNRRSRPVLDSQGNNVLNAEAVAMKDALMARVSSVKVPDGPLEMVLNVFGVENVAEITGRSRRVVERQNEETGKMERVLENRTFNSIEADASSFMDGNKNILVFSDAGGTGRSYHAELNAKNQKRRMHYLIQAGWQATKAVQGFGRTHRSNQSSAPVYKLFTTNLKGQMRFVSSIARRLDQLGALTKGQRQTGSQGMFSSSDNLEGPMAGDALKSFYQSLANDSIPTLDKREVLKKMGLEDKVLTEYGSFNPNAPELIEVTKFLNRILALESELQNEVFGEFQKRLDWLTQQAIQEGVLDEGLENLKVDSAVVIEESEIYKDETSSSKTIYSQIEVGHKAIKMDIDYLVNHQDFYGVFQNKMSKAIRVFRDGGTRTLPNGRVVTRYIAQGQERHDYRYFTEDELKKSTWEKIEDKNEARKLWSEASDSMPGQRKETIHMISGALLPVWDRLPADKVRVVRLLLDNGEVLLGRLISENAIDHTLAKLGAGKRSKTIDISTIVKDILNGSVAILSNDWKLIRRRIAGEYRIELIGQDLYKHKDLIEDGVFTEKIAFDTRYFVPTGDNGTDVIRKITKHRPIIEVVAPSGSSEYSFSTSKEKPKASPETAQEQRTESQLFDIDSIGGLTPLVTKKVSKIVAKFLGTPIRDMTKKAKAEGTFDQKTMSGTIRRRSLYDFRVLGHELGHAFSFTYGGAIGSKKELKELALQTYPGKVPKGREVEEGFAEFFYIWMTDPHIARELAPQTTDLFEDFISDNKELSAMMSKVRVIIDSHLSGTALERGLGAIVSHVDTNPETAGEFSVAPINRFTFNHVDSNLPAGSMMKDLSENVNIPVEMVNLRQILSVTGDAPSKALMSFKHEAQDYKGTKLGYPILQETMEKGINLIGEAIQWKKTKVTSINKKLGALEIFSLIGLANRVIERSDKGYNELPLKRKEAEDILNQAKRMFPREVFELSDQYAENLSDIILEKLLSAGLITKQTVENVKKGSSAYYPFFYDDNGFFPVSGKSQQGKTYRNPVKRFRGQKAAVLNLFQATMMKLTETEQAIEYKRAIEAMHVAMKQDGMGKYGEIMSAPPKTLQVDAKQVIERVIGFLDADINVDDIGMEDRIIQLFMPGGFDTINNPNVIMNVRDGKPVFMRLAPDVFKMMMAMRPVQINAAGKALAILSQMNRYTSLATLLYMKNVFTRDLGASLIQTNNKRLPLLAHYGVGIKAALGLDEETYNAYASSGGMSGVAENVMRSMLRSEFDEGILRLGSSGWGTVNVKGKKVLVRTARTIPEGLRVLEEYKRIAEFVTSFKKNVNSLGFDGNEMWELYKKEGTGALPVKLQAHMERILIESAYDSREIEANYGVGGVNETSRKYFPTVTFMKGSTKGIYRYLQLVKNNPKTAAAGMGALTLLAIASWVLMNMDDDDAKVLNDMDSSARDKYYFFPSGVKGVYISIAKPYEYGIVANFMERSLDHLWANEPNARKPLEEWKGAIGESFGIPYMPRVFEIWGELQRNENFFGGQIVPQSEQRLAKDMQYGPNTTKTAIGITSTLNYAARLYAGLTGTPSNFKGTMSDPSIGVSPRQVEHFIRGMTGQYGEGFLKGIDWVTAVAMGEPTKSIEGIEYAPVIGRMLQGQAEGGSRITTQFYDDYNKALELSNSTRAMMKNEDTKKPSFATEENANLIKYLPAMRAISNELSAMRKEYDILKAEADPEQRRKLTMQQNYVQKLGAGLMYGIEPASPNEDSGITDLQIKELIDHFTSIAQKALLNEQKSPGGPTEQAIYLLNLIK